MTKDVDLEVKGQTRAHLRSYLTRRSLDKRDGLFLVGYALITIVALAPTLILLLLGAVVQAALVLGLTILIVVLGAFLIVIRINERASRLTKRTERFTRETRKTLERLHTDIEELSTDVSALKESERASHALTRKRIREKQKALQHSQEEWHALTRKRLREKHDSIRREIGGAKIRNSREHDLTRKRLREKSSELRDHMQSRIDRSDRLRRRAFRDLHVRLDAGDHVTEEDATSLRKVIFDILQEGRRVSCAQGVQASWGEGR